MGAEHPHIIRNIRLRLQMPGVDKAFALQQQAKASLEGTLQEALGEILNKYAGDGEYLHIPRLELALDPLPEADFEKHFHQAVLAAVDKALAALLEREAIAATGGALAEQATAAVARVSQEAQCLDGWFYFLGKGTLPWWQSPTGSQTLEQQWIAAARTKPVLFRERWYRAWAHRQINVPRWLEQSSPAWRQVMLEALCPAPLIEYYRQLERDMGSVKYAAWHSFFDFLDAGHQYKPEAESLLRIFLVASFETHWKLYAHEPLDGLAIERLQRLLLEDGKIAPLSGRPPATERDGRVTVPDTRVISLPEEGIPVQDAGLVLLHPFLIHLFRRMEWLTEKDHQLKAADQQQAVHLLAFLGSGAEQSAEYEMVLPKVLCGMPLETPIARNIILGDQERQQAEALLQAVLEHWPPLNSSSITALRETFLQRPGLLQYRDGQWILQVEQRTVDVLLNRLPWGISMIRLAWMPQLMRVDWAL